MSLTRFRYFYRVARLGSIREAADTFDIAPSAISRQIERLEQQLGVDLFEPNGRGIRLTPAGEILAQHASTMLDALTAAQSQINDLMGLRRGHVQIWSVEGSVSDLILPAVAQLKTRYSALTYELTVASSDRVIRAVLDDEAEVAVAFNPPHDVDLDVVGCSTSGLLAVSHPTHEIATRTEMSLAEVCAYPIALPNTSFGLRHMVDAAAREAHIELNPSLCTNSIEALVSYARVGIGLTILPYLPISKDLKRGVVSAVRLTDSHLHAGKTAVLIRRGRLLQMAAQEFSHELIQRISREEV